MRYLDLTLPNAAGNLALDEALLEEAEGANRPIETLRFWEPDEPMVVVGRSSRVATEVRLEDCRRRGIPVFRRTSGGAAIVAGPGCLMYALVLSYELRPALRAVDEAHRFVMSTIASALEPLVPEVSSRGISDLAIGRLKFSGNSLRCKRENVLYHGTLLYDFPLQLIGDCLAMPPRMPDYRENRPHERFVANIPLEPATIRRAIKDAFAAAEPCNDWPCDATARLAEEKYSRAEWNESR